MSATVSSSVAPTSTAMCDTSVQMPTEGALCAVADEDKNRDIMERCCNSAPVVAYDDECVIYCLVKDQSVQDLLNCLFELDVPGQPEVTSLNAWCVESITATTTATEAPSGTSTSDKTDTKTESETESTAKETDAPSQGNMILSSKAGLALCMMVIPALFAGVLF